MKPGDYPDGAYVWHDVEYVMKAIEEDSFAQTPAEHVQTTPTEWPHEGMIEDGGSYGLAYLTVRRFPYPEEFGVENPTEETVFLSREQAIHLRDWLNKRLGV